MKSNVRGRASLETSVRAALAAPKKFAEIFRHGTFCLEVYAPRGKDPQAPHTRDEVYIVMRGSGVFRCDGTREAFSPGDFLFVPAGMEHGFEDFTDDFATWVIFYGPEGGESP